jgi:hypothetical protein
MEVFSFLWWFPQPDTELIYRRTADFAGKKSEACQIADLSLIDFQDLGSLLKPQY